jgi:prepilin-type N-terminal cleavage/methylation domain-containing protein
MKSSKWGFTLLEILVVISIIGLLVAMGSVAYSTAQKKGRDARRKGDLKAIQNALEQCYSLASAYPTIADTTTATTVTCIDAAATVTMSTFPKDPKNDATHKYVGSSSSTGYTITATL